MQRYLGPTLLLNFQDPSIQGLIAQKNWRILTQKEQILQAYNFVRDEILFGFNANDTISASDVLAEGIGQCNTKTILFMALLRALQIPCRLHGFTIDKKLQAGIMNDEVYELMPDEIVHTWAEVHLEENWFNMEGLILDQGYLKSSQQKFKHHQGDFSGFGVATKNLHSAAVFWDGQRDTCIQKEGIVQDYGVFDDPDAFFKKYSQKMTDEQVQYFSNTMRHEINKNISAIRKSFCANVITK